jgi:hypothetical protein
LRIFAAALISSHSNWNCGPFTTHFRVVEASRQSRQPHLPHDTGAAPQIRLLTSSVE